LRREAELIKAQALIKADALIKAVLPPSRAPPERNMAVLPVVRQTVSLVTDAPRHLRFMIKAGGQRFERVVAHLT